MLANSGKQRFSEKIQIKNVTNTGSGLAVTCMRLAQPPREPHWSVAPAPL